MKLRKFKGRWTMERGIKFPCFSWRCTKCGYNPYRYSASDKLKSPCHKYKKTIVGIKPTY